MSDLEDLKRQVNALERFRRDVIMGGIIIGCCLAAFLGYQSYIGIPQAINELFKQSALKASIEKADIILDSLSENLSHSEVINDEIKKTELETKRRAASVESQIGAIEKMVADAAVLNSEFNEKWLEIEGQMTMLTKALFSEQSEILLRRVESAITQASKLTSDAIEYPLLIHNKCRLPIKIALAYRSAYNVDRSAKWWTFESGQENTLNQTNVGPVKLGSKDVYFYAVVNDESVDYEWSGDNKVHVGGELLSMRRVGLPLNSGRYLLALTCDDL